jgi:sulfide:quinone oxidoreductase
MPGSMERLSIVIAQMDAGVVPSIVFAMPTGPSWALPLFELAMFTAARAQHQLRDTKIELLIPDASPLSEFGEQASINVAKLLAESGVALSRNCNVTAYSDGVLTTDTGRKIKTDFVVALPKIRGTRIDGLAHDSEGFLPVDRFGIVGGTNNIYAAGDITDFRIKQGGIASQQADVATAAIIERFGGRADSHEFEPTLDGLLLSPFERTFMHAVAGDHDASFDALEPESFERITQKIFSKRLTSRLTELMGSHASVR